MGDNYRPGDFYRICDRTGFKIRASQTKKEWNGLIVRDQSWEPRHPQDFIRGRADRQIVSDPRPEPSPRYVGPLVTNLATDGASVGETALKVDSLSGMQAGDTVYVTHEGGTLRTTISTVDSSTQITLVTQLPSNAPAGAAVTDSSRITTATDAY